MSVFKNGWGKMTVHVLGYIKWSKHIYFLNASKGISKSVSFHVFDWRGKIDVLVKYNSGDLRFFNCIFYLYISA